MQQYKPGDNIGGEYRVLKVFGGESQSGMGVVYLVENREIPVPIILKTFQSAISEDAKRRFLLEAHSWVKAGAHSNIVQSYWVREIAGQIFIAAEYVEPDEEGRNNLSHYLNIGQLCNEIILLWTVQFCHGMAYAISKGVLAHRDVKPDNLMIDRATNLKVTDFGLAKSIDLNEQHKEHGLWFFRKKILPKTFSKTLTHSAMGTLPYMAPEQFINAKYADHRSDIYSFGIVLYQMVTGNLYPYRINTNVADISAEFYNAHINQKPQSINSPLMPIICRCLEKKPNHRYSSCIDFIDDVNIVAQSLNIRLPKIVHIAKEDEELYSQAQSYVALGDKDGALKAIDEYVSKYPEKACGWTDKGRIHLERYE